VLARLLWIGVTCAAAAALLTQTHLQRTNTLHRNGAWKSGKLELALGVHGAVSFLLSRRPLRLDRLHPGTWHGYQEVLHQEPLAARRLEAGFRIPDASYLTFLLRRTAEGFEGVRLSRHPAFPSACLQGRVEGAFTERVPLPLASPGAGQHRLRLEREEAGVTVLLDGRRVGRCASPDPSPLPARFGVRGADDDWSRVDWISARGADGRRVEESFANRRGAAAVFAVCLVAVGALALGAALLARHRGGPEAPRPEVAALLASGVALVIVALLWATDAFYLSKQYPRNLDLAGFGYETSIEGPDAVAARMREAAAVPKPANTRRLLVVGTSQAWGAGARRPEDHFVRRLGRALDAAAPDGVRVETHPLAVSGARALHMLRLTEREGLAWRPDAMALDLSNNDRVRHGFGDALEGFVDLAREHDDIHLVFIPEPNAIEDAEGVRALRERHAEMERVAAEHGIPVVPVHEWLAERADTGFLWWDDVHLTSWGQALLAERLFEKRAVLLPGLFGAEAQRPAP